MSLQPELRRTLRAGLDGRCAGRGGLRVRPDRGVPVCRRRADATEVAARLAGSGTCAGVKVASGPAPGARLIASV